MLTSKIGGKGVKTYNKRDRYILQFMGHLSRLFHSRNLVQDIDKLLKVSYNLLNRSYHGVCKKTTRKI